MGHIIHYIKTHRLLSLVIALGAFTLLFVIIPSGSTYCFSQQCGLYLWGVHSQDMIWHITLANVAFAHFPFQMPLAVGETLRGYNFLLDLFVFLLTKLGISAPVWYFKIIPVVWFIAFTTITIKIGQKLHNTLYGICLLFFFYFGGSFAYFFTLRNNATIWGSSGLVALQSAQTLLNLQFAISLLLILVIAHYILKGALTLKTALLFAGIAAVSIGMKFYGGVIIGFAIGVYYTYLLIISRKLPVLRYLLYIGILLFSFTAMVVFVYDPFHAATTGSTFSFSPFALMHSIIEEPYLFYLPKLVNARYYLQSVGSFSPRLIAIELLTLAIFLVFNLGTRIIGLFSVFTREKKDENKKALDFVLKLTFLFSLLLTVVLIQKGEWWNTIQFFYYTLFIAAFFAARTLFVLMSKPTRLNIVLIAFIVIATIPSALDSVKTYFVFPAHAYIPQAEIEALNMLAKQPQGVVYASLYKKELKKEYLEKPIPLFADDDTGYVAGFSKQQLYYANYNTLNISGIPTKERREQMENPTCRFLSQFDYAYLLKKKNDSLFGCDYLFQTIFENSDVKIMKKSGGR